MTSEKMTDEFVNRVIFKAFLTELSEDYEEFRKHTWSNYLEMWKGGGRPDYGDVSWAFTAGFLRGVAYERYKNG